MASKKTDSAPAGAGDDSIQAGAGNDSVQTSAQSDNVTTDAEQLHDEIMRVAATDEYAGQGGSYTYDQVTKTRTKNPDPE